RGRGQGGRGGIQRRGCAAILRRLLVGSRKDWLNGRLGSPEVSPTTRETSRASGRACIRYAMDRALPAGHSRVQSPDQWNEGCARSAEIDPPPLTTRARGRPARQSSPGSSAAAIRRIRDRAILLSKPGPDQFCWLAEQAPDRTAEPSRPKAVR